MHQPLWERRRLGSARHMNAAPQVGLERHPGANGTGGKGAGNWGDPEQPRLWLTSCSPPAPAPPGHNTAVSHLSTKHCLQHPLLQCSCQGFNPAALGFIFLQHLPPAITEAQQSFPALLRYLSQSRVALAAASPQLCPVCCSVSCPEMHPWLCMESRGKKPAYSHQGCSD